jgi:hypothetical protein
LREVHIASAPTSSSGTSPSKMSPHGASGDLIRSDRGMLTAEHDRDVRSSVKRVRDPQGVDGRLQPGNSKGTAGENAARGVCS